MKLLLLMASLFNTQDMDLSCEEESSFAYGSSYYMPPSQHHNESWEKQAAVAQGKAAPDAILDWSGNGHAFS